MFSGWVPYVGILCSFHYIPCHFYDSCSYKSKNITVKVIHSCKQASDSTMKKKRVLERLINSESIYFNFDFVEFLLQTS